MRKLANVVSAGCIWALSSGVAWGQDLARYNQGLTAFNAGDFDAAAVTFHELAENSRDLEARQKSEYYLAQSLLRKGLPASAAIYFALVVKGGPKHPLYLKGVEGLVNVQQLLDDDNLIPNLLNSSFSDTWATLPPETMARINYLIGVITQRLLKFEEAKSFLEAVPPSSPVYPKARYMLGVVLVDPRFPGGAQKQEALRVFQQVIDTRLPSGASAEAVRQHEEVRELAMLGLGRTYYGDRQYENSSKAYERVPRFSRYWDQALFENAFARFQNDDSGGALGSLQALHAPQFAGAFQPESWILKGQAYYFSCLYDEVNTAMKAFSDLYLPMGEALKPWTDPDRDVAEVFKAVSKESPKIPRPVLLWVRGNERVAGVFQQIAQIDREKALLKENQRWRSSRLSSDLSEALDQNRSTLVQVGGKFAKNRLMEASRNIKTFADQAEIIRFETSKAEKELAEAGVDQRALLKRQRLFRPQMPAEDWNYWKFQGEFWIDEIGYYQYTLKRVCLREAAE